MYLEGRNVNRRSHRFGLWRERERGCIEQKHVIAIIDVIKMLNRTKKKDGGNHSLNFPKTKTGA